jgi:hypothetical protein
LPWFTKHLSFLLCQRKRTTRTIRKNQSLLKKRLRPFLEFEPVPKSEPLPEWLQRFIDTPGPVVDDYERDD